MEDRDYWALSLAFTLGDLDSTLDLPGNKVTALLPTLMLILTPLHFRVTG